MIESLGETEATESVNWMDFTSPVSPGHTIATLICLNSGVDGSTGTTAPIAVLVQVTDTTPAVTEVLKATEFLRTNLEVALSYT
jgi:acyl-CoA hydrolase